MENWIAVVDDDEICLTNARNILKEENMRVSCLRSGTDLIKFIEKNDPDLILLDVMMPGMNGFETYNALREHEDNTGKPHIPVIFLTGENDSEIEHKGLQLGASDFIRKPFYKDILVKRIDNTIKSIKAIEVLTEEAMFDKLTGFLNKARGTERVSKLCSRKTGALMIMDLDNFKLVNDIYGHDMGDKMLQAFAAVVKKNTRETDTISRIGGDEFMAFYEDLTAESAVASLALRLNTDLLSEAAGLLGEDNGLPLGISIGCAFVPEHGTNYDEVFALADGALYTAKQNGKHGYHIYHEASEDGSNGAENLNNKLDRIFKTIEERNKTEAALFLGRESFAIVYRFVMRFYKRYSGTATFLMLAISSEIGQDNVDLLEEMQRLEIILQKHLRVSDIVMQTSGNSFLILLTERTETEAEMAAVRIIKDWGEGNKSDDVRIEHIIRYVHSDGGQDKE